MAADLTYEGCNFFRQRLVLATLSGKSVKIKNIRAFEDDPGLKGTAVFICEMQKSFSEHYKFIIFFLIIFNRNNALVNVKPQGGRGGGGGLPTGI